NNQRCHGFYNNDGPGYYTGIMPAFSGDFRWFTDLINGLLGTHNRRYGLKGYAEGDVHSIGNTALDASREVGQRFQLTGIVLRINKDVVVFGSLHFRPCKTGSVFKAV